MGGAWERAPRTHTVKLRFNSRSIVVGRGGDSSAKDKVWDDTDISKWGVCESGGMPRVKHEA